MHSERIQQVHGQRSYRSRRGTVGARQVDPHSPVSIDGLYQDPHRQAEALRVGAVGITQQGDLIIGHAQGFGTKRLLEKPKDVGGRDVERQGLMIN